MEPPEPLEADLALDDDFSKDWLLFRKSTTTFSQITDILLKGMIKGSHEIKNIFLIEKKTWKEKLVEKS